MSDNQEQRLREGGAAFFGAVAASLSHDLSNVLATVNELSGLLDDLLAACGEGVEPDPQRLEKLVGRISGQVKRGKEYSRLLNRMAHSMDEPRSQLDVAEAVREVCALCERFARLRKVTLDCASLGEVSATIETDPFELRQMVYRAIELAHHGAREGAAIRVACETDDTRLRVLVGRPGRVHGGPEVEGRLDLLKLLVARLHGELECCLAPDLELGMALPLVPSAAAPQRALGIRLWTSGTEPDAAAPGRVLLIDDEVEFVETLAERLRTRGLEVECATSGTEGIEMAGKRPFDTVILDYAMPGMDGVAALKILRQHTPDLKVLLLTGQATIKAAVEAARLGASDVLEKPIDIDTLLEKIRGAGGRRA